MRRTGGPMPVWARIAIVCVAFAGVCSVIGLWGIGWLRTRPPQVAARTTTTSAGTQAYLTIETVGSIGYGPRPTWVSYLAKDPSTGQWVHTTRFQVPANATVHVTLYQYDTSGTIRNPYFSKIRGTVGGTATYQGSVGTHKYKKPTALSQLGASDQGHTFTVPKLGVSVPLGGSPNPPNICAVAPCNPSKNGHTLIHFSFKTGASGNYRWQCFVPCGLNFVDGNSGPMQTFGYMMGMLDVS